jgi:hypothetical protein
MRHGHKPKNTGEGDRLSPQVSIVHSVDFPSMNVVANQRKICCARVTSPDWQLLSVSASEHMVSWAKHTLKMYMSMVNASPCASAQQFQSFQSVNIHRFSFGAYECDHELFLLFRIPCSPSFLLHFS